MIYMSKLPHEYHDYRNLALDLLGRTMHKERDQKLEVFRVSLLEKSNNTYSAQFDAYCLDPRIHYNSTPVISDSTRIHVLTGGEKLSLDDMKTRLNYELTRVWDSLSELEKGGRMMVVIEGEDSKKPEFHFAFRKPKQ